MKPIGPMMMLEKPTMAGLLKILQQLVDEGYGNFPLIHPDIEAGPRIINSIQFYDTHQEQEQGALIESEYFMLS